MYNVIVIVQSISGGDGESDTVRVNVRPTTSESYHSEFSLRIPRVEVRGVVPGDQLSITINRV